MINHIRTLLLNRDGRQTSNFGEELVPADYRVVSLPRWLASVDSYLFGARADRACRNYRLRQLLPVIHHGPLADHLRTFDTRITYDPFRTFSEIPPFPILADGYTNQTKLYGEVPDNAESGGRMEYEWIIEVIDDSPTRITINGDSFTPVFDSEWSNPILLPGTKLKFSLLEEPEIGSSWTYRYFAKPVTDLGVVAAILRGLGDVVHSNLFGVRPSEPYLSFQNAAQSTRLADCLSGYALAMAHRIEELRRA